MKKESNKYDNMALLTQVPTDVEACVIQGLLDSCGISTLLDYDIDNMGSLKVVIGSSNLGVSIYVNKDEYDDAKAILEQKTPLE